MFQTEEGKQQFGQMSRNSFTFVPDQWAILIVETCKHFIT